MCPRILGSERRRNAVAWLSKLGNGTIHGGSECGE